MILVNNKKIQVITQIAAELAKQQTADDLRALIRQGVKCYNEAELAAEIAVKLFLRITGIAVESRAVSPVDELVSIAEKTYRTTYAG